MLIEQSAYANRWRKVSPSAKAIFAMGGFVAAFAAGEPRAAVAVACILVVATLMGAGIPAGRYLRIALPALFFLGISCLSLAFSLNLNHEMDAMSFSLLPAGMNKVAEVGTRSLGALAALLFLVLTTPLTDLIALLRRLRTPEVLLELMVICYRMLFVFSEAMHDIVTAQSARLGYATPRLALRSLGGLTANLTVQIWQRAHGLHIAAQARNNDGPLRFLEPVFVHSQREIVMAAICSGVLVACAVVLS